MTLDFIGDLALLQALEFNFFLLPSPVIFLGKAAIRFLTLNKGVVGMYVFYDTETTGLDKDFSQILQIALVFTDDNLNILSTKKVECRVSPWTVASPGALLTTGFIPDDLKNNKLSHYEMMREVDTWARSQHWPVLFVGYNSMNYDEPVFSKNLFENLLDADLTRSPNPANSQTNGRGDVMLMVRAAMIYMPGVLTLNTLNDYGSPSLTLKNVAAQNGVSLSDEDAHDALNDIRATIGVAKVVQKAAPQIWAQMNKLSTTAGVEDFIATHKTFTYLNAAHGSKAKPVVMTGLTPVDGGKGELLFDLSIDPTPYMKMTAEELKDVLLKKYSPFATVQKDAQPILMPVDLAPNALPTSYNEKLALQRAKLMQANPAFLATLAQASELARAAVPAKPVLPQQPETTLNQPVPAGAEGKLAQWVHDFHHAHDWHDAAKVLKDFYVRFKDELAADAALARYAKLAGRIIFEHAPNELTADQQQAMKKHIASRLLSNDLNAPYMTIARARKELEQIEQERAQGRKWKDVTDSQIRTLKLYYTALEKEYEPFFTHPRNTPANDSQQPKPPQTGTGSGPKL